MADAVIKLVFKTV